MADEVRMRRVLAHIEDNPDLWDQNNWVAETVCGTSYCYAGWTVVLEGIPIQIGRGGLAYVDRRTLSQPWLGRLDALGLDYLHGDNQSVAVSDVAALILGLYEDGRSSEKWGLFGACLTLDDLRQAIDRICAGKPAIRGGVRVRSGQTDT